MAEYALPNTFQLVGWFTFGTFLILKGAFLNSVYEQKQSGGSYGYGRTFGRSLTEELGVGNGPEEIYFKLPYVEEWTVSFMIQMIQATSTELVQEYADYVQFTI